MDKKTIIRKVQLGTLSSKDTKNRRVLRIAEEHLGEFYLGYIFNDYSEAELWGANQTRLTLLRLTCRQLLSQRDICATPGWTQDNILDAFRKVFKLPPHKKAWNTDSPVSYIRFLNKLGATIKQTGFKLIGPPYDVQEVTAALTELIAKLASGRETSLHYQASKMRHWDNNGENE